MSLKPVPQGPLRKGYTTGANATACASAALRALLSQQEQAQVTITLPRGERVSFTLHSCTITPTYAICTAIKDAGDDPDVTHGAEIGCKVTLSTEHTEVRFLRGEGVGVVTLAGLGLPVGEPAINPVPRQMICTHIQEVRDLYGLSQGVNVTVFVKQGEVLAKKTLNARVGVVGGLSILGTTGIVEPYSAASYIASIQQGINVAITNGITELVLSSGAKSEGVLKRYYTHLPEQAFIHYGNWIGEALHHCHHAPLTQVRIALMLGKAVKLAAGQLDTHSAQGHWDMSFIAQLALTAGYSQGVAQQIQTLTLARQLPNVIPFAVHEPFYQHLRARCKAVCHQVSPHTPLEVALVHQDTVLTSP